MTSTRGNRTLKLLDRYLGVPALMPFALAPKRALDRGSVRRIGLMKTAALGDTLLLAGLIDDVKRTYPSAALIAITGADNRAALELFPDRFDEHIVVAPRSPREAIGAIRRARLDVLVDFGSWPRFDAMLAACSGAKWKLGFATAGQHRHYGYDRTIEHSSALHERDNYARLLAELGVRAEAAALIDAPSRLSLDKLPPAPYIVFHAWSGGYMHEVKEWPDARWAELAKWVHDRGCEIVLSGSPADGSRCERLAIAIAGGGATVTNAAGAYTIAELADVLAASEAVVSVNTGIAHLAGLVGAATISLEGPTPPHRWRPLGPRVRTVVSTTSGAGYLNLGFEYAGQRLDCMEGVHVDAVASAIDELVAESASGSRDFRALRED